MTRLQLVYSIIVAALTVSGELRAQPTPPRARLTEELRLDATIEDFPRVGRVYVGPRGQIVVPIAQDNNLRIYDSTGRRTAVFGRKGAGPGEFQSITAVGWVADTMWVVDFRQLRVTYVSPAATVLRTMTYPISSVARPARGAVGPPPPGGFTRFTPDAILTDASMIGDAAVLQLGASRATSGYRAIIRVVPGGGQHRQIARLPNSEDERWMMVIGGLGNPIPFTAQPFTAVSPSGDRVAHMTSVATSREGGTFTVTLLRTTGDTAFVRTFPFRGVLVPQSAKDSALAEFIPRSGAVREGSADLPRRFQAMARQKMPAIFPGVEALLLGLDNTVWVGLRRTAEGQTMLVLDGRGEPVASVLLPPGSRLLQASATRVWIAETDRDGLTSVVRYRVSNIARL
jgi:hypothetical protein